MYKNTTHLGNVSDAAIILNSSLAEVNADLQKRYDLRLVNTIVGQGSDLNNFVTPYMWAVPSAEVAATLKNMPITSTGGKLVVEYLGKETQVRQTYITHTNYVYTRVRNGDTWTIWKCLTEWINQAFDSIAILENEAHFLGDLNFGLAQKTDLNNLKSTGVYQISSSSDAATMKNLPITTYGGRLIVECLGSGTNIMQTFLCHNGVTYQRIYTGGEWKAWRKLSTEPV